VPQVRLQLPRERGHRCEHLQHLVAQRVPGARHEGAHELRLPRSPGGEQVAQELADGRGHHPRVYLDREGRSAVAERRQQLAQAGRILHAAPQVRRELVREARRRERALESGKSRRKPGEPPRGLALPEPRHQMPDGREIAALDVVRYHAAEIRDEDPRHDVVGQIAITDQDVQRLADR
jgi:hypothetical protein